MLYVYMLYTYICYNTAYRSDGIDRGITRSSATEKTNDRGVESITMVT